ncbi:uncharacterized protein [Rutidosis leptorrhynchoides]|uniref:uncharacterized protein isoform X2 n=1 Tax=Rutidosis leptorrhynchoides TaxID=125765 RepID=UPI003A9A5760
MLRPHYPLIYKRDEMPDANSISEVCVVIDDDDDDTWKAGDMVDWNSDGAYWSTRVTEVLTDDKVKIELPMPPAGERKDDETHEALCKDLRPNLVWSQRKDWSLPTVNGKTHVVHACTAYFSIKARFLNVRVTWRRVIQPHTLLDTRPNMITPWLFPTLPWPPQDLNLRPLASMDQDSISLGSPLNAS